MLHKIDVCMEISVSIIFSQNIVVKTIVCLKSDSTLEWHANSQKEWRLKFEEFRSMWVTFRIYILYNCNQTIYTMAPAVMCPIISHQIFWFFSVWFVLWRENIYCMYLKCTTWWSNIHTYRKMITTVEPIHISPHTVTFLHVWWEDLKSTLLAYIQCSIQNY